MGRALNSKSEGWGFDSQCWSCEEVWDKFVFRTVSLHPAIMGTWWINSCRLHWHLTCQGKDKVWRTCIVIDVWTLNRYLYLLLSVCRMFVFSWCLGYLRITGTMWTWYSFILAVYALCNPPRMISLSRYCSFLAQFYLCANVEKVLNSGCC